MKVINVLAFCFIVFLVFILAFYEKKFSLKFKKRMLLFLSILISVICSIRVIGLDLEPYRRIFQENGIITLDLYFLKNMFSNRLEPFFAILISLIKQVGLDFKSFLFISAVIPMFVVTSLIIKKEKDIPIITFLFFLLLWLFRGPVDTIRHFFAAVVYLSAIYSLSEGAKVKFYLKSLFSILLHYSNVAVIFARPFLKIKWSLMGYLITIVTVSLFAFLGKPLIIEYFSTTTFTKPIMWKLQYYLIYSQERYVYLNNVHEIMRLLMTYSIIVFNISVIIVALANRKVIETDMFYKLLLNSQIIGSILFFVFIAFDATTLGQRLNFLFTIGNFFIVKQLIFNKKIKHKLFPFVTIILFLCLYNFIVILYFAGIHDPNSPFSIV